MIIMLRLLFFTFFIHAQKKIEELKIKQMLSIRDEYLKKISGDIKAIEENLNGNRKFLVQDVLSSDFKKIPTDKKIVVLDMGGTYFKIAHIDINCRDNAIEGYKVIETREFEYPKEDEKAEEKYWYDWAAKKLVDYVKERNILPNFCSMVFSYPIFYKGDQVYPLAFTKFFCFEKTKSLKHEIISSINKSILDLLVKESLDSSYLKSGLQIKSVLNDSVANYFYSKALNFNDNVAIILGTGTNAAFSVEINRQRYVFNSEWGAFKPSLDLLPEEEKVLEDKKKSGVTINFLDTIAANGCRTFLLNEISKQRKLGFRNVDKNNIQDIAKNTNAIEHKYYKILSHRSKQILASLLAAIIKLKDVKYCNIILNGSGFNKEEDCLEFIEISKKFLRDPKKTYNLTHSSEKDSVLIGSAFYTFYKSLI